MKARGQRPIRARQEPLESALRRIFAEVDERPVSVFAPPLADYREAKAREVGISAVSNLKDIVHATKEHPDVFAHLPWVRERLLQEALSNKNSHPRIRAWARIVSGKLLHKS